MARLIDARTKRKVRLHMYYPEEIVEEVRMKTIL